MRRFSRTTADSVILQRGLPPKQTSLAVQADVDGFAGFKERSKRGLTLENNAVDALPMRTKED